MCISAVENEKKIHSNIKFQTLGKMMSKTLKPNCCRHTWCSTASYWSLKGPEKLHI